MYPNQTLQCPKCRGTMRMHNRSGIQLEQCDNCHGIFLDYGELEALTQLGAQWGAQPPPPQPGYGQPAWGAPHPGHHGHRGHRGFGRMLFSS